MAREPGVAERGVRRAGPVVIAGGGTGGHVFPGLAVARELRARRPDRAVEWIGAAGGFEERLAPEAGLPTLLLPLAGMARTGLWRRLRAVALAGWATLRLAVRFAMRRPALLIGVGGFASGPAVLAGAMIGTPTLLLEQNALAGATNRWLSRFVRAAAITFPESAAGLKCRAVVTGNPVRADIAAIPPRPARPVTEILGFGGSRGARALNGAWCGALPLLRDLPVHFVLQTGAHELERVTQAAASSGVRAEVLPFIDDMPARLAAADLVISRAGATTVAELTAAGRAALLVPFPFAANNHQLANARSLAAAGAAALIEQTDLTPERLASEVRALVGAPEKIAAMSRQARNLARADAAARVADLAEELLGGQP